MFYYCDRDVVNTTCRTIFYGFYDGSYFVWIGRYDSANELLVLGLVLLEFVFESIDGCILLANELPILVT